MFSKAELPLTCSQERIRHIELLALSLQTAYPNTLDLSLLLNWLSTTQVEVTTALEQVKETKKAIRDAYYHDYTFPC